MQLFVTFYSSFVNWCSDRLETDKIIMKILLAICLHISLSVMVLYSVVYKKPVWFWLALLWHAFVDAAAVYLLPIIGAVAVEGVVAVMAIVSLAILFGLRPRFRKQD